MFFLSILKNIAIFMFVNVYFPDENIYLQDVLNRKNSHLNITINAVTIY